MPGAGQARAKKLASAVQAALHRKIKRRTVADPLRIDLDQTAGFAADCGHALALTTAGIADRHTVAALA